MVISLVCSILPGVVEFTTIIYKNGTIRKSNPTPFLDKIKHEPSQDLEQAELRGNRDLLEITCGETSPTTSHSLVCFSRTRMVEVDCCVQESELKSRKTWINHARTEKGEQRANSPTANSTNVLTEPREQRSMKRPFSQRLRTAQRRALNPT